MCRVILEGPDGAGKTTLGMQMADEIGLGFYRRRTLCSMLDETIRGLGTLKDCVLDRSWLTDVFYSKALGRSPGCSRTDIYRFGLLAAARCALHLICLPPAGDKPRNELEERLLLQYEHEPLHWSVPRAQNRFLTPINLGQDALSAAMEIYEDTSRRVDSNPDKSGTGSSVPCPILMYWHEWDRVLDLLFSCGVRPDEVHICDFSEASSDLEDYFKPKLIVHGKSFKYDLRTDFNRARAYMMDSMRAAGIEPQVLEKGWEFR